MGSPTISLLFSAIGWICLYVWYRDRKKIETIKEDKYAGHYGAAGRIFVLNLIAGVGAITMFGVVILTLVLWIYRSVTD